MKHSKPKYTFKDKAWIGASFSAFAVTTFALAGVILSMQPSPNSVSPNNQDVLLVSDTIDPNTAKYVDPVFADYVVSNLGEDDNDGSYDSPLATIQEAVDRAYPGDIIVVLIGEYNEEVVISVSGTPELPIKLLAEEPGRVELIGDRPSISAASESVSDWQIRGFGFKNISNIDIAISPGSDWQVADLSITEATDEVSN